MTITRTTWLIALGVIGFAVAIFGAADAYRGRIQETPPESGFYSIPEHQGRTLALTIAGAFLTLASLILAV